LAGGISAGDSLRSGLKGATVVDYDSAFRLNYGVFSQEQQDRIRAARVTILGLGGAGAAMATLLARSGVSSYNLIDPGQLTESELNWHISCFVDTLGELRAEVTKRDIQRINPAADVQVYPRQLSLDELGDVIEQSDVFVAASDDLALSSTAIVLAEQRNKFAITWMPSGLTGYVAVFPPDLPSIVHPEGLFGAPKGLSYAELHDFLRDPLHRCGRRWYVTQGKWRIGWFVRWRKDDTVPLAQVCANAWLGASLACIEVLKYLTGTGQPIRAPQMWHVEAAENRVKVKTFRRRTTLFCRYILWAFNLQWRGLGRWVRRQAAGQLEKELAGMERQEQEGKELELPFLWRHVI